MRVVTGELRIKELRRCAALAVCSLLIPSQALAAIGDPVDGVLEGAPGIGPLLLKMVLVLGGLILVLLLAAKLLPRWIAEKGNARGAGLVEIIERRPIDARKSLLLVRVAGRFYLIGSSEAGLHSLSGGELDQEALNAALDGALDEGDAELGLAERESSRSESRRTQRQEER